MQSIVEIACKWTTASDYEVDNFKQQIREILKMEGSFTASINVYDEFVDIIINQRNNLSLFTLLRSGIPIIHAPIGYNNWLPVLDAVGLSDWLSLPVGSIEVLNELDIIHFAIVDELGQSNDRITFDKENGANCEEIIDSD